MMDRPAKDLRALLRRRELKAVRSSAGMSDHRGEVDHAPSGRSDYPVRAHDVAVRAPRVDRRGDALLPAAVAAVAVYVLHVDWTASLDTNQHDGLESRDCTCWTRASHRGPDCPCGTDLRVRKRAPRCDPGDSAAQWRNVRVETWQKCSADGPT